MVKFIWKLQELWSRSVVTLDGPHSTATATRPAAAGPSGTIGRGETSRPGKTLAETVDERIKQGLAPPAEVHQVHNRKRIDWSAYPAWARPADPDMFDGCGHEG